MGARRIWLHGVIRRTVTGVRTDLRRHQLMLYAGALTFYAMIAVIPLVLVAVWMVGLVLGGDSVRALAGQVAEVAPPTLGFNEQVADLAGVGSRLGGVSLVAALIAGTTYGEGLVRVFDLLYGGVDRPRKALLGRLLSLPALAVFPLFVGIGLVVAAWLTRFFRAGTGSLLLGTFLAFCVGWVASTLLVVVIYRLFGPVRHRPAALWWGSAATASFLTGMSEGWLLILGLRVQLGRAYGGSDAVAGAAAFAAWLFLVHATLVVGLLLVRSVERALEAAGPAEDGLGQDGLLPSVG